MMAEEVRDIMMMMKRGTGMREGYVRRLYDGIRQNEQKKNKK